MNLKNRYLMLIMLAFIKGVVPDLPGRFDKCPTEMISLINVCHSLTKSIQNHGIEIFGKDCGQEAHILNEFQLSQLIN